jgi:lipoprotein-anchoring transpeptidase ErfK/SrfK
MRKFVFTATLGLAALIGSDRASADVIAQIDISAQRMTVTVDGEVRYVWPVSTARRGYATPIGSFRPIRMERTWYSTIYQGAPMPYAIFFYYGFAVHGTNETAALGRPVSHGCVRLPTSAARELFDLILRYGPTNSRIVVTG